MSTKNIKLFEHNSSRLLFVDNQESDFKLDLEELEQDSSETDKCNCDSPKFLLGKLNNYIWLLEDSGIYDSNHTHQANINHTDINDNTETLYNVTRIMEISAECDRIYTAHSGGLKFVLLDSPSEDQIIELFIKYERSLPCIEQITDLRDNNTGDVYPGCLVFWRYNNNNQLQMYQVVQLIAGLTVRNDDLSPMNNINYCDIDIKNIIVDFNRLKFTYSIEPNTSNDIKISFIGTQSLFTNPSLGNYGKFIGRKYYENNDNYIEPGIFLIQVPQNRSWICYRIFYSLSESPGSSVNLIHKSNNTTFVTVYEAKYKNNCKCFYLDHSELNGYYGNLENNKYIYEININRNSDKNWVSIMIPTIFNNYESFEYFDNNGNKLTNPNDLGANNFFNEEIYNELDGIYYKCITIPIGLQYCKIYKIKITYNQVV